MHTHSLDATQESADSYLFGRRQAWFAFAMTIALMVDAIAGAREFSNVHTYWAAQGRAPEK